MKRLKKHSEKCSFGRFLLSLIGVCTLLSLSLSIAFAGPEGAQVISGDVTLEQSGYNTTITASDRSIINYSSFDIAQPEVVEFVQPSSSAAVLNRILSASPTQIDGTLLANGRVFFVNPAGVMIGEGATINVNQLVASGLDITNENFLAGQLEFAGGGGSVANYGDITAESVYLVGKQVANAGNISCPGGYVVMAAGDRVFLGEPDSSVIVEVDPPEGGAEPEGSISVDVLNEGTITADNGKIVLAAGDIYSRAISNVGALQAASGTITMTAAHVVLDGELSAPGGTAVIDPVQLTVADGPNPGGVPDTVYEEDIEALSQGGTSLVLEADETIAVEDILDDEIEGGTGDITLQTTVATGSVYFEDKSDTISTTTGDITIQSGGGGIDVGNLITRKDGGSIKVSSGDITVTTTDGGNITTGDLRVLAGWVSGSIYVDAGGDLTVNGDVSVAKHGAAILNVPNGDAAAALITLSAGDDVVLNGDVGAYAHGKEDAAPGSVTWADIGIFAGTDGTSVGDVTINGNLTAEAKASSHGTSHARIKVLASGDISFGPDADAPFADADRAQVESFESALDEDRGDIAEIIIGRIGDDDDDDDSDDDGGDDDVDIEPAPLPEVLVWEAAGCPALMDWLAEELGLEKENIQHYLLHIVSEAEGAVKNKASSGYKADIQLCQICANLRDAATVLADADGAHLDALQRVVAEVVAGPAPLSEEQMAVIATALAEHKGDATYYATAGEWLDAMAEYVGILSTELGLPADQAVILAAENYVTPATESADINVAAFVNAQLEFLGG
jgi:filamentous hemagglutinin family protein